MAWPTLTVPPVLTTVMMPDFRMSSPFLPFIRTAESKPDWKASICLQGFLKPVTSNFTVSPIFKIVPLGKASKSGLLR